MARIPIIMPKMSMTMTEGEVATWFVKVGDQVNEGDVVAEVMTDKVDMEVESTHSGTLVEITVEEGMVAVGDPIGYLEGEESGFGDLLGDGEPAQDRMPEPAAGQAADTDATPDVGGDVPADPPVPGSGQDAAPKPSVVPSDEELSAAAPPSAAPVPAAAPVPEAAAVPPAEPVAPQLVTPAVPRARGLAQERGLDLAQIRGTGPDGLITVADVEAMGGSPAQAPVATQAAEPSRPSVTSAPPAADAATASTTKRKPTRDRASLIRAAVARKMVESASVPQFTVWRDIVLDDANGRRQGLSWTTVLLRAYAAAMRDVPELLCRWENDTATLSGPPSVALAVATPGGLMVPVFAEPDRAAPRELDAEIKSVVAAVQQGRLDPAYLKVANGSLSNLGGLGVDRFQALVTPPQASVLALGSIKQRPTAVPGGVGVALTVTAGVTIDHRVADGAHAATLLERFTAHIG
jgi:pyruvate dehydrogenase E2 component (dihydrolipoamide acetyltransferase)